MRVLRNFKAFALKFLKTLKERLLVQLVVMDVVKNILKQHTGKTYIQERHTYRKYIHTGNTYIQEIYCKIFYKIQKRMLSN